MKKITGAKIYKLVSIGAADGQTDCHSMLKSFHIVPNQYHRPVLPVLMILCN